MRRFALFISSEKYQHYDDTPYCHADAEKLRETLLERCDYLPENSLSLALEPDDEIDSSKIIDRVTDLINRSEDGDSILFFFCWAWGSYRGGNVSYSTSYFKR